MIKKTLRSLGILKSRIGRKTRETRSRKLFLEDLEDRRVLSTISGTVFQDANSDGSAQIIRTQGFDSNPNWTASNNQTSGNNYGYSETDFTEAESGAGEIGGRFARTGTPNYYADLSLLDSINLKREFSASGEFYANHDGWNNQVHIGFFNTNDDSKIGIGLVESHEGDSIRAHTDFFTATGSHYKTDRILLMDIDEGSGRTRTWTFNYTPSGESGQPEIRLWISGKGQLSSELGNVPTTRNVSDSGNEVLVTLPVEVLETDASFNAFGLYAPSFISPDENLGIDVFVDQLTYTAGYESGVPGIVVYLDSNNNGVKEPSEVSETTNSSGDYAFAGLEAGDYIVRLSTERPVTNNADSDLVADLGSVSQFTASNVHGLKAADFDMDGDVDLVAANHHVKTTSIHFNDGNGSFDTLISYNTGTRTGSAEVGDFDGDQDIDIVVTQDLSGMVKFLWNDGEGGFTQQTTQNVGDNPRGIDAGDIDGDGDLDLVVVNVHANTVSILENEGGQSFSSRSINVGSIPLYAEFGDIDNDGDLDFAVTNHSSNDVRLFENDGSGEFTQKQVITTDHPNSLAWAFIDNNTTLDLVVTSPESNNICVLLNTDDATLSDPVCYQAGSYTDGIVIVDYDLDGTDDVVVANRQSDNISVFTNDGNGNLSTKHIDTGNTPIYVTASDFNSDGLPDIAVGIADEQKIGIHLNLGLAHNVSIGIDEEIKHKSFGLNDANPTLDSVDDLSVAEDSGEQTVDLTGI
ncbi:MAG TPA: hypothetical protein DHW38_10395, partial [Planctomycetaceae bacterium]|nr:hypothetical protein [Planctomycetaceae bacterium]